MKIKLILPLVAAVFLITPAGLLPAAENTGGGKPATYEQLKELAAEREWWDIVAILNEKDLTAMADAMGEGSVDRLYALRGHAHSALKLGPEAEADYRAAIELVPDSAEYWYSFGLNYRDNLMNPTAAVEAFQQAIDMSLQIGNRLGWLPISSTIDAAGVLYDEGKYDEALSMLNHYSEAEVAGMAPVWKIKMLRALGNIYLAQGQEKEAQDCFQKVLETEAALK
jgi:tetratricopeptide (TPR) repeat protein